MSRKLTKINVEGVNESKRKKAESEIRKALDFFKKCRNPIDKVIVTNDFNATVRNFLSNSGIFSLYKSSYEQTHEYGIAYAKTIPCVRDGELLFNLILDGKIVGNWLENQQLDRRAMFCHEFIHMLDDELRFKAVGEEQFVSEPKGYDKYLFHNSWIFWQEYHAEREVLEVFEKVAEERSIQFDYSPKLSHFESLIPLLSDLPSYLRSSIRDYRNWKLTPTDISQRITGRVVQILILSAYVHALADAIPKLKDSIHKIETIEGWQLFISESWTRIHVILKELYSRKNEYVPSLISEIGSEVDSVFKRCGLETKDAKEGYYIEVHDI